LLLGFTSLHRPLILCEWRTFERINSLRRPRNDVRGNELSGAACGLSTCIHSGLYGGHVAVEENCYKATAGLLPCHNAHLCRFCGRIGSSDETHITPRFNQAQRFLHRPFVQSWRRLPVKVTFEIIDSRLQLSLLKTLK
jgi:hypothetical protein